MSHTIKIARAKTLAGIGPYHRSFEAMLAAVPASVVAKLSSRQLAELIDANWCLAQSAKALAEREAIDNGFVWDARTSQARDLAA